MVLTVAHLVAKFQIFRAERSAVPRFHRVVPANYGKDHISGDDDIVAVPNAIVMGTWGQLGDVPVVEEISSRAESMEMVMSL
jgi:hypothetical protein